MAARDIGSDSGRDAVNILWLNGDLFLDEVIVALLPTALRSNQSSGMMTNHYSLSCNYLAEAAGQMTFPVAFKHNFTLCSSCPSLPSVSRLCDRTSLPPSAYNLICLAVSFAIIPRLDPGKYTHIKESTLSYMFDVLSVRVHGKSEPF